HGMQRAERLRRSIPRAQDRALATTVNRSFLRRTCRMSPSPLLPLADLLARDLESICVDLDAEFGAMAGNRLLITGGGGFLGYYLVQAALHWNRTRASRGIIRVTVYDNYARGVPQWLEDLA